MESLNSAQRQSVDNIDNVIKTQLVGSLVCMSRDIKTLYDTENKEFTLISIDWYPYDKTTSNQKLTQVARNNNWTEQHIDFESNGRVFIADRENRISIAFRELNPGH